MLIQEFCRTTGLGRDTVRFYVKRGLLTPAVGSAPRGSQGSSARAVPSNRYQVFDAAQVERARLIREAQALGFTLAEIAALAASYERGALTAARKAEVLRAHLAALDARAARLDALRAHLGAKLRWVEGGERGAAPSFAPRVPAAGGSGAAGAPPTAPKPRARSAATGPARDTRPRADVPG
jgi:DNA-binding transcriptional MerR regulator